MTRAVAAVWTRLAAATHALREQVAAAPPVAPEVGDADAVAQAVACGLVAARCGPHTWTGQRDSLLGVRPRTHVPLAGLFGRAADGWPGDAVDGLVAELDRPETAAAIAAWTASGDDPVAGFYEHFLAGYDPAHRQRRGVYYTPRAVVDHLVRSAHELLAGHWGPAAEQAVFVDPACGSGLFLAGLLQHDESPCDLLPRLHGLELMPAALAVAHLALERQLADQQLQPGDVRLHHADTLAGPAVADLIAPIPPSAPLVVIGNPPYAGHSQTGGAAGTFIGELLRDYHQVDGRPLGERNPKWLQDDYVKFLRWAQWLVERHGHGLVAFVTNHGFLENPTFRGLRHSLMASFDDLYVLDLHGNAKRQERAPDGGIDQNLFRIQQGVALSLLVRRPG